MLSKINNKVKFISAVGIAAIIAFIVIQFSCKEESTLPEKQDNGETEVLNNEDHDGGVHLEPEQVKVLGIRVEPLKKGHVRAIISRPATVSFDLDRLAKIGPRITAKVVKVIKDIGDRVEVGETVAIMSSVELGKAKAQYLTAKARVETELKTYEREKTLYEKRISSEASMLEAQARYLEARAELDSAREALRLYGLSQKEIDEVHIMNDQPLSYFPLKSSIKGVIQRRDISPGDTVSSDETPIIVVDTQKMWVMVDAFERDIPLLQLGQKIELKVRSIPGRTFSGIVDWISRELEKETRTVQIRAVIDNPDQVLRAGMFGTALIHTAKAEQSTIVPVDAVQTVEEKKVIFIPGDKQGSFKPVQITLGEESDGWVEIVSELKPGMPVVTAGAFHLKAALTASERNAAHGH